MTGKPTSCIVCGDLRARRVDTSALKRNTAPWLRREANVVLCGRCRERLTARELEHADETAAA